MRNYLLFLGLAAALNLSSCVSEPVDSAADIDARNDSEIQQYVQRKNLANTTRTASGLVYVITTPNPAGKKPAEGEEVEFRLTLSNLSDARIDTSIRDSSAYLTYGIQAITPGLEEGFSLMREGERAILLVPSRLAFGNRTAPNLAANSPVRFDVNLVRSRTELQAIDDHIARRRLTVTQITPSGVRVVKTLPNAAGAALTTGQTATVRYTGRFLRTGQAFDSGSIEVTLGRNQVVKGFEEGIQALRVGERANIYFPSSLGYGKERRGQILPYSTLSFEIEIISVR